MRAFPSTALRVVPLMVALAALPGCVKFGAKPPAQLLTISAKASPQAGQSVSSTGLPVLAVFTPDVPRKLDNLRVEVHIDPTRVAYVQKAQWAEAPRQMFEPAAGVRQHAAQRFGEMLAVLG